MSIDCKKSFRRRYSRCVIKSFSVDGLRPSHPFDFILPEFRQKELMLGSLPLLSAIMDASRFARQVCPKRVGSPIGAIEHLLYIRRTCRIKSVSPLGGGGATSRGHPMFHFKSFNLNMTDLLGKNPH